MGRYPPLMVRRFWPAPVLLFCVLFVACGARVSRVTPASTASTVSVARLSGQACNGPPPPAPTTGSRLSTIGAAYRDLLSVYFRPLQPSALLRAAWQGATAEVKQEEGHAPAISPPQFSGQQPDLAWRSFAESYAKLSTATEGHVDQVQLADAAVAQMAVSVHEGHTYFVPASAFAQEGKQTQVSGIGVEINGQKTPFTILGVVSGGPASRAGVRPGDTILNVDGCNAQPLNTQQLGDLIRGPAGTQVQITFGLPSGSSKTLTITRALVSFPLLQSKLLPGKIGYVRLTSFPATTTTLQDGKTIGPELDSVLATLQKEGATGWILDLRGNPGGNVDGLRTVGGVILPPGTIFSFADRQGHRAAETTEGKRVTQPPLRAVLVDGGSASAAEILSSAIQDEHVAPIVGTHTAGVANGAELLGLPGGAGLSITHFQTYTVDGTPLNGAGVAPNVSVQATAQDLASGSDPQLQKAVSIAKSAG